MKKKKKPSPLDIHGARPVFLCPLFLGVRNAFFIIMKISLSFASQKYSARTGGMRESLFRVATSGNARKRGASFSTRRIVRQIDGDDNNNRGKEVHYGPFRAVRKKKEKKDAVIAGRVTCHVALVVGSGSWKGWRKLPWIRNRGRSQRWPLCDGHKTRRKPRNRTGDLRLPPPPYRARVCGKKVLYGTAFYGSINRHLWKDPSIACLVQFNFFSLRSRKKPFPASIIFETFAFS